MEPLSRRNVLLLGGVGAAAIAAGAAGLLWGNTPVRELTAVQVLRNQTSCTVQLDNSTYISQPLSIRHGLLATTQQCSHITGRCQDRR